MGNSLTPTLRRSIFVGAATILGLGLSLGISGCPVGADLENPDRFGQASAGAATAGAGPVGGTGGGGAGGAGMAGTGTGGTGMELPDAGCDYLRVLDVYCAVSGCHQWPTSGSPDAAALLDLTPDMGLWGRMVNSPATYADIDCDAAVGVQACVPPGCPPDASLINSANVEASWMLNKIHAWDGSTVVETGCGRSMPLPSAQTGYDAEEAACLDAMVRAMATAAAAGM